MAQEKLYFLFIQSLTLLNKYLDENNYNMLSNYVKNLHNLIISPNDEREKVFANVKFLKNLHILYLYFSNYPYLYGVLTDEEIDNILSVFKPDINQIVLGEFYILQFNSLIHDVDKFASKINKGISILHEKENLKLFQKLLIIINLSKDQMDG